MRLSAPDRPTRVPMAFGAVAVLTLAVAPGLTGVALEVAIMALIGLSLDVVVRQLGTVALFHPGVVVLSAWATASLLGRNQSPVIALVVVAAAGAALSLLVLAGQAAGRAGLSVAGLAAGLVLTAVAPPAPGFLPPVFVGVDLGTPRAALVVALVALGAGVWLRGTLGDGDLARWLLIARGTPELVARAGVSLTAVRGSALAIAGALAALAGWAAAIGTLGAPAGRSLDPAIALAWLLVPLAGGPGVPGALLGALVFTGVAKIAAGAGLSTLVLAAPLAAALLWRETAR